MVVPSNKTLLLLTLSLFSFATAEAQDDPFYLSQDCSSEKTNDNTSFQFKVKNLLSDLSSNAIGNTNIRFYNTTITGENPSDSIYGLFMCRGDVSSQLCQQCVQNATLKLSSECSLSKQSLIWYEECMVWYSTALIFSTMATKPGFTMQNSGNVSNPLSFMPLVFLTLNKTADEASLSTTDNNKFFATRERNVSGSQTLYCLAQCTPNLSPLDCRTCLGDAIGELPGCCEGRIGGRVLFPSCNIRYELYPFYDIPSPTPTPKLVPETKASHEDYPIYLSHNCSNKTFLTANNTFQTHLTTLLSTLASNATKRRKGPSRIIILIVVLASISVTLFFAAYYFLRKKARKSHATVLKENFGREIATLDSLQFDLATVKAATNNFSDQNKIGKGGFGEVYKGILLDGSQVAIKRLSKSSKQGANEFKNEVLLIAKLQHRNLVTLKGFCLDEQEKILIYEYVTNMSLDYFLFDSRLQKSLSWFERYNIIGGIAQGILYLHEHSRWKVIHRDLKPSNILLDEHMIPKISDFGLARIVEISEDQGSTNIIVGTYGYMSPEYAMLGQFSEKSDVFSFGVMILEIISGKKNLISREPQHITNSLLHNVWKQWRDDTLLNTLDPTIIKNYSEIEVIRCIQIGLLCVQEDPNARPTIVTIISYLNSHFIELPTPQEPALFLHGRITENAVVRQSCFNQSVNTSTLFSINEMSSVEFLPR
uniref:Cysteine-rich receptor-like protein kinase 10 n=1 Tax=Cajanus cajan TaxID=3821 RepID=A0A151T438_CAJCA|nr:Cysteine-rich receptor-like protein kinase 10 [Cajanus cajan]